MKSCLLGCGTVLAAFLVIILVVGSLNYSGFCWSKMRYLSESDTEIIRKMFNRINSFKNVPIQTKDKGMQYFELIKYKSFEFFMEQNPDCCAIESVSLYEIPENRFIDRITGFNNGKVIEIDYIVRYLDENGIQNQKKIQHTKIIKNCGEIKW